MHSIIELRVALRHAQRPERVEAPPQFGQVFNFATTQQSGALSIIGVYGVMDKFPIGTIMNIGVYGGFIDKFPMGSVMNRSLTIKTGQCHVQRYMRPLLERIERGELDPSFVITHQIRLDDAPKGYDMFVNKEDECVKVVLKP
jgi:threonine dehydrogenase-like Zn-dependent dehydrogenase